MEAMSDHEHDKQLRILQGPPASKPALNEEHGHDHGDEEIVDDTLREHRLELSTVREKLKDKSGKQYWRTLEELSEDPHFEELLHREFPRHASEWDDAVDRRDFLKLMGASLALAGLAGCGRPDESHIVPYVKQPDGMVLGKPNYYATVMPFGADAVGVLVESHEGRPTKIEGNPDHPASLGATSAIVQASILNLYDPDRAQTVLQGGEIRAWSTFLDSAQEAAIGVNAAGGAGFRILTGTVTSPTLASQLKKLLALYPQARWHEAGVWPRCKHSLCSGQGRCNSVAGRGFPGERAGAHFVRETVGTAAEAGRRNRVDEPAVRGGADADGDRICRG